MTLLLGITMQVTLDSIRTSQPEGDGATGVHQGIVLGQGELTKAIPDLEVVDTAYALGRDLHSQVIVQTSHNLCNG